MSSHTAIVLSEQVAARSETGIRSSHSNPRSSRTACRAREPRGRSRVRAGSRGPRRGARDDRDALRDAHVGLEADELERLAGAHGALKLSASDLPVATAQGATGGTTVAATALLASEPASACSPPAGIGGVHRGAGATFDESADLGILASCRITVVSGGVKSILDIGATLERLETLNAPCSSSAPTASRRSGSPTAATRWTRRSPPREEIAEVIEACRCARASGAGSWWPTPCRRTDQLDLRCTSACSPRPLGRRGRVRARQGDHPVPARLHPPAHGATSVAVNLEIVRGNCRLGARSPARGRRYKLSAAVLSL